MHQEENMFSDDVSKTFMDSIDEVPDDYAQSPYFAKRARSITTPASGKFRMKKKSANVAPLSLPVSTSVISNKKMKKGSKSTVTGNESSYYSSKRRSN